MTKQLKMNDGMRIVLPGTWVRIPLDDPDETQAFVKRLVKRQTGAADRLARIRRETAQDLMRSALDAAQIGVHTYFMSLEILPGVPFPSALLLLDEKWPEAAEPALEQGDVATAISAGFGPLEVAEARFGPFGRRWEVERSTIGEEEMMTLRLEYVVPYPDGSRVLMARASVPNIPHPEPFGLLFNEIIDSMTFPEPGDAEPEVVPTAEPATA
jgi:hypothetical protein